MDTPVQLRGTVESDIRMAFRGVKLDRGISLRQAQLAEASQVATRDLHSPAIAGREITDDWSRVPQHELERCCVAHLDALGFRYYIPALMLSVLSHYEPSSMRVIGTISGLYPKIGSTREYQIQQYSLLSLVQKRAVARFLVALPQLVELDHEDRKIVPRALRNYWGEYLQTTVSK